jgi:hypothetical protein
MAQQKIVYLVTTVEYEDLRPELAATTREIADATAANIPANEYPNVTPITIVDYVPARVTVWRFVLRLGPVSGWVMWREDLQDTLWDFEAPKHVVGLKVEGSHERRGDTLHKIQFIHLSHQDQHAARVAAETMLEALQAGARLPAGDEDDTPE